MGSLSFRELIGKNVLLTFRSGRELTGTLEQDDVYEIRLQLASHVAWISKSGIDAVWVKNEDVKKQ